MLRYKPRGCLLRDCLISGYFLVSVACIAVLSGCAALDEQPSTVPPLELDEPFSGSGSSGPLPERWWLTFDDPHLNARIDQALEDNWDLRGTWQRFKEASALIDQESAALFPNLELSAQAQEQDPEPPSNQPLQMGLSSEYEIDLWGRLSSGIEAQEQHAYAARADYRTAALSLAAEVTRTWYQLAATRQRLALLEDQVATSRTLLELARRRVAHGQAHHPDILRQRQQVAALREQRQQVRAEEGTLEHQLAVLLGEPPQSGLTFSTHGLPTLPEVPATGLPAQLVQRRPDVRSAFHQLKAANQEVAAAVSRRFPRLTLTAEALSIGSDSTSLTEDWSLSLTAGIIAPLLDAGRRAAEAEQARAVEQRHLYTYAQTVLTSFQEVEDALLQERHQRRRVASLEQQVADAGQAYEQLRQQYRYGITDYQEVLSALNEAQSVRRELLAANHQLVDYRIALYRALAGGFPTEREASS